MPVASAVPITGPANAAKVAALFTSDNWSKRRRLLFSLIWWEVTMVTLIIVSSVMVPLIGSSIYAEAYPAEDVRGSFNLLLTVVCPALIAGIVGQCYTYITGANDDDKDKRANLPPPRLPADGETEIAG